MPLYDFFYVDSTRLTSLQQQLGTGSLLETIEKLKDGGHVRNDWRPQGSVFIELTGDLFVASKGFLEFAASSAGAPPDFDFDEEDLDEGDEEEEDDDEDEDEEFDEDDYNVQEFAGENPVKTLFERIGIPALFVLVGKHGDVAGGAFREECMIDPVSSFYVRSSPGSIQNVIVLGVAEPKVKELASPQGGILEGAYPLLTTIFAGMLPDGAVRMTPVAMYREIGGGGPRKR